MINKNKTKCEFCKVNFLPKANIKNPRACNNPECQRKRQRLNEKEWREKNKQHLPNAKYHKEKKEIRVNKIKQVVKDIVEAITVGSKFLNKKLKIDLIQDFLEKYFIKLGIKFINKLLMSRKDSLEELFESIDFKQVKTNKLYDF